MKTIAQGSNEETGIFKNTELLGKLADKLCAIESDKFLSDQSMANIKLVRKAFGSDPNCTEQTRARGADFVGWFPGDARSLTPIVSSRRPSRGGSRHRC